MNCVDLIESWTDLPAPERNAIHAELLFDELLCPNITTIQLEGNLLAASKFVLSIYATQKAKDLGITNTASLWSQEITRYFNPSSYLKLGYEDAVASSHDVSVLTDEYEIIIAKQVSRLEVTFFNSLFIDASAIDLIDFGNHFTDFKVASSKLQHVERHSTDTPYVLIQYS